MMDVLDAINDRRAVRDYTDGPVDQKTLHQVTDAAVQAPSAVNSQAWSFCVVRNKTELPSHI
jgi:nitroreductase